MPQHFGTVERAGRDSHFHSEASSELDKARALFTDDIVWQSPTRYLISRGKESDRRELPEDIASFKMEGFRTLQRFATEDRVVDDSVINVVLTGDLISNKKRS